MFKFNNISLPVYLLLVVLVMASCSKLDPIEPMESSGVSLEKGKDMSGEETMEIGSLSNRGDGNLGRPDDDGIIIDDIDVVNDDDDEENDDEEQTLVIE